MIVFAHRGASAYYKENTLEAFKGALALNAKYTETDVQRSKDGVLVICHDYALPDGRAVAETDFSALEKAGIVSVRQVLELLGESGIKINLEIKNDDNRYPEIEKQLFELLSALPCVKKENLLISSFDFETLKRVRSLDETVKIGVLTRRFDVSLPLSINAYSVNISEKRINAEIMAACKNNGLKVFVYTVNDYKRAKDLEDLGVDGIFSDYPDILQRFS